MKLASLLDPELIATDIKATLFTEVITALVDLVAGQYPGINRQAIMGAVLERETLSSTAIGKGFAIPHARTDEVEDLIISIGISKQGVAVKSPDQQPAKILVLILTPVSVPRYYLQTLSAVSRFAKMPESLPDLLKAKDRNGVVEVFFEANVEVAKQLRVRDIISEQLVTIRPDNTLRDAANLFFEHRLAGLPVVDEGGALLGEITDADLLKFAIPNYQTLLANLAQLPESEPLERLLRDENKVVVKKVMTSPMASVGLDSSITEVVALMLFKGARRVAVLDQGKLVGVIAAKDIIDKIVRG